MHISNGYVYFYNNSLNPRWLSVLKLKLYIIFPVCVFVCVHVCTCYDGEYIHLNLTF